MYNIIEGGDKMEKQLQFFKIPNQLLIEKTDSEIFTFIILNLEKKWGECKLSQENIANKYGNTRKFYSNAINNLTEFITVKKNYSNGGTKENNTYIINEITDDFTIIFTKTIDKLKNNYKLLSYYCKLKRWVNNETFKATQITKVKIGQNCGLSKNTSNMYLKELVKLEMINIIDNEKYLNCFDLTLLEEIELLKENNEIKEWNNK
jgi:hypothetical protein